MKNTQTLVLLVTAAFISSVQSWENAEFEMFDLVEEVGQNFYEVFEIPQDAPLKDIKQAYRKLSVKLHPDKNPEPDAATKFRQIVGIYEVLKDPETRIAYNTVLVEGLPNWRQPIYYYRRYRKLALWQVSVIVIVLVSMAQYLGAWAGYLERSWSLQEVFGQKLRRSQRTRKAQKDDTIQEELKAQMDQYLQKPSMWNILPFQFLRFCKYMVMGFPGDMLELYQKHQEQKKEEERLRIQEEQEAEIQKQLAEEPKKPKKRKVFSVPEKSPEELQAAQPTWGDQSNDQPKPTQQPVVSGGLWTDEDIGELAKLCSKFPGGTPSRWETIANILCRPVPEVTFMAKKVLEGLAKKPVDEQEEDQSQAQLSSQVKVKVKTKGGKGDSMDRLKVENWSADEQKALESALQLYPKGASERWEKISATIPGRTKEECMQRFKYVADLVKKSKEKRDENEQEQESTSAVESPAAAAVPQEPTAAATVAVTSSKPAQEPKISHPKSTKLPVQLEPDEEPELDESYYTKTKGKKVRKRDLRRTKEMERQNSSSSNSDQDWCLVDNDKD